MVTIETGFDEGCNDLEEILEEDMSWKGPRFSCTVDARATPSCETDIEAENRILYERFFGEKEY